MGMAGAAFSIVPSHVLGGPGKVAPSDTLYIAGIGAGGLERRRIDIDDRGTLYIADTFNNRIRKVDYITGIITTIAGNGEFPPNPRGATDESVSALAVSLYWPCDIAIDSEGRVFFADTFNHCVRRIDLDGTITTIAGQCGQPGDRGDGDHPQKALLSRPYGIELDLDDNLYIADTRNHRIRLILK